MMRKGEELKAPRHASAAATRDHTWYIPDNYHNLDLKLILETDASNRVVAGVLL